MLASVANAFPLLLAGRALQGIGGGGITVTLNVILADLIPLRERGKWFGYVQGQYAIGTISGPIVGGAFAQHASWVIEPFLSTKYLTLTLPALDLLDQHAVLWHWTRWDSHLLETAFPADLDAGEVQEDRLGWLHHHGWRIDIALDCR